jgi:hypothetical protein
MKNVCVCVFREKVRGREGGRSIVLEGERERERERALPSSSSGENIHLVHTEVWYETGTQFWRENTAHFQKYFVSDRKKLFHTIWNVVCILLVVSHHDVCFTPHSMNHIIKCVSHHTFFSHQKSMFQTIPDETDTHGH